MKNSNCFGRSTFIVEVDAATFVGAGLERMDDADSRALCQIVFADALEGLLLLLQHPGPFAGVAQLVGTLGGIGGQPQRQRQPDAQ